MRRIPAFSMRVLVAMYGVALLAEPLAPRLPGHRDVGYAYAPPQLPAISWRAGSRGVTAPVLVRDVDPITLRNAYVAPPAERVRLRLWVHGDAYRLWGVFPCDVHLFGRSDGGPLFVLGADRYGRDLLSRVIYGARVSLSVGLVAIAITFVLGLSVGGISGYAGGRTDTLIQRGIEIISSFPHLPLWLALGAVLPQDWSPLKVYFAITTVLAALSWTGLARVVRGKLLALREEDYVLAARLLGASHGRVIFKHLLPGFASHIIVSLSLAIPAMILAETALSFLGLGLRPPIVSWGVMLQDCLDVQAVRYYPWLMLPIVPVVVTVLAFNFLGDGIRDAADPHGGAA